jgi:Terminase RNaseH-like domain
VRLRFGLPEGEIIPGLVETLDPSSGEKIAFLPARAEDNPHLNIDEYDTNLRKLGNAKYQQLRWGRWIRDGEGLVYGAFDPSLNVIADAPHGLRSRVLSQDYGTTNATSWTILGWRDNDPVVYVLRSYKREGVIPSENGEIVQALEAEWKFQSIVGDVGGLGKAYAEEARRRFLLPIKAADKNNKRGYIELLNGELERGRVRIVNGAGECADLIDELKKLPWKPHSNRSVEATGFPNHCTDGLLYGWREASAYCARPLPSPPTTPAAVLREELDQYWERLDGSNRSARDRAWWDDGTSGGSDE